MDRNLKRIIREGIMRSLLEYSGVPVNDATHTGPTPPVISPLDSDYARSFKRVRGAQPTDVHLNVVSTSPNTKMIDMIRGGARDVLLNRPKSKLKEDDFSGDFISQMTGGSSDDRDARPVRGGGFSGGGIGGNGADKPVYSEPGKKRYNLAAYKAARDAAQAAGQPRSSVNMEDFVADWNPAVEPTEKDFSDFNSYMSTRQKWADAKAKTAVAANAQPDVMDEPDIDADDDITSLAADINADPEELKRGASIAAQDANLDVPDEVEEAQLGKPETPEDACPGCGQADWRHSAYGTSCRACGYGGPGTEERYKGAHRHWENPAQITARREKEIPLERGLYGEAKIPRLRTMLGEMKPAKPIRRPEEAPAIKQMVKPDKINAVESKSFKVKVPKSQHKSGRLDTPAPKVIDPKKGTYKRNEKHKKSISWDD